MSGNRFGAGDLRVVDGDDIEWNGNRFRLAGYDTPETHTYRSHIDRALEHRRGNQARHRLLVLIAGARAVHMVPWGKPVSSGNRQLGSLLIDGWEVASIAIGEGWGGRLQKSRERRLGRPAAGFCRSAPGLAEKRHTHRRVGGARRRYGGLP